MKEKKQGKNDAFNEELEITLSKSVNLNASYKTTFRLIRGNNCLHNKKIIKNNKLKLIDLMSENGIVVK